MDNVNQNKIYLERFIFNVKKKLDSINIGLKGGSYYMKVEELASKAKLKDLKEIAKKHDIKLGRCPTKLSIAKKIPRDELEELVAKSEK